MDYTFWLELFAFILLIALSGFFSSSETALFSLKSIQIEKMRQEGHPRANLIKRLLRQPRRLIITILIGNELVNITASVLSAAFIFRLLGGQNIWLNPFIMVPILLLMGEIIPKTLAVRNNVAFASFESGPIEFFARLIKPLRWIIRNVADGFITLIVGKERSRGNIITEDMVRTLAYDAVDEGDLDSQEAEFIDQILAFDDKTLGDIMTPRSHIFFLPEEMPLRQMMAEIQHVRHTKAPVYRQNRDSIIGILHIRGLLGVDLDQVARDPQGTQSLLLKPYFVPETKLASELFHTFRNRKLSLAITVDEYGGVTGLVTMEDLLECIFGDIHSPSDINHQSAVKQIDDTTYSIDAGMPVEDFNHEMGCHLAEDMAQTIGGLLLHHYGELPSKGTAIKLDALNFTVKEVAGNRIRTLLLTIDCNPKNAGDTPENQAMPCHSPPESVATLKTPQGAQKNTDTEKGDNN